MIDGRPDFRRHNLVGKHWKVFLNLTQKNSLMATRQIEGERLMPYHVRVTTTYPGGPPTRTNLTEGELDSVFLTPRCEGRAFVTGGQTVNWAYVHQIRVFRTGESLPSFVEPDEFLRDHGEDVTDQFITSPPGLGVPQHDSGDVTPLPEVRKNSEDRLYYNVRVETKDDARRRYRTFALDLTREEAKDLVRMCVRQKPIRFKEEWLVAYHDFTGLVVGEDERMSEVIIAETKWPTGGRHPEPREWCIPKKCQRQVRDELWSEVESEMASQQIQTNEADTTKVADPRKVFVVYGRDERARKAMFDFLRSIGLHPLEWTELTGATGKGAPYIGEILDAGFGLCQAVVVVLTGDDLACLREDLRAADEPSYEIKPTPQARPNVLFEAGLAMGRHPDRTILVELGQLRPFSDVGGRYAIRFDNSVRKRQELAMRLHSAGCSVNINGTDWHKAGRFLTNPLRRRNRGRASASKPYTSVDVSQTDAVPATVRERVLAFLSGIKANKCADIYTIWDKAGTPPMQMFVPTMHGLRDEGIVEFAGDASHPETGVTVLRSPKSG